MIQLAHKLTKVNRRVAVEVEGNLLAIKLVLAVCDIKVNAKVGTSLAAHAQRFLLSVGNTSVQQLHLVLVCHAQNGAALQFVLRRRLRRSVNRLRLE